MTSTEQLYYLLGRLENLREKAFIAPSDLKFIEDIISENEFFSEELSIDSENIYEDDQDDQDYSEKQSFGQYSGTYAQDEGGLSDNFIDDVLGGEPEAYWNID
jgi:hypothetical protein